MTSQTGQRVTAASALCPACDTVVGEDAGTVRYNGFDIGVCGPACDRRFNAMSTRDKDAFIGRLVEPVTDGCPLSPGCPVAANSPYVTYEGTLFQVCCQTCLDWWEKADDETRTRVFERRILPTIKNTLGSSSEVATIRQAPAAEPAADGQTPNGVALRIGGMTCQACVDAVEESLGAVAGVTLVGVDLDQGLAWVGFETPGSVPSERLVKAVEDAGFSATPLTNAIVRTADTLDDDSLDLPSCGIPLEVRRVVDSDRVTAQDPLLFSIGDSLDPIVTRFNADVDRPRVVALLSPTCGGCLHGARALQEEIIEAYPDRDLSLLVIWEPMLGGDSEEAAREAAKLFDDPRVHQFWDGERLSGISYSVQVFPTRMVQIAEAMPADHFLSSHFQNAADVSPDRIPMWDFAAFYPADVRWQDTPPRPLRWIRQLAIMKTGDGATSATLLTDDFSNPPIESDWFDEVRREMRAVFGEDPEVELVPASRKTSSWIEAATPAAAIDIPIDRAAAALVDLSNTTGDDALRRFIEDHISAGARKRNTDESLMDALATLRENLEDARLRSVDTPDGRSGEVVLQSSSSGLVVSMSLDLEAEPPHRIDRFSARVGTGGDFASGAACAVPDAPRVVDALGIETIAPNATVAREMGLAHRIRTEGRVITAVTPGGPAASAGLREGDVLIQLGDNKLYSQDDIDDFLTVRAPGDPIEMVVKRNGSSDEQRLRIDAEAPAAARGTDPAIAWQFAGLGQLDQALSRARETGKLVMVGLSGSDTCCAFSRFEAEPQAAILDDPDVIERSGNFIPIIVRRPHAYWFLESIAGVDRRTERIMATPRGIEVPGRELLPIPSVFFIDPDRSVRGKVALADGSARESLLELMDRLGSP